MRWFSIFLRPSLARPSSIHSGWYHCSFGICPNWIGASVNTLIRLWTIESANGPLNCYEGNCWPFELWSERLLVKQYPRIFVIFIESILHLPNTLNDSLYIVVTAKENKRGIRPTSRRILCVSGWDGRNGRDRGVCKKIIWQNIHRWSVCAVVDNSRVLLFCEL